MSKTKNMRVQVQNRPFIDQLAARINRWSRLLRIITATAITVITVGLLMSIFDLMVPLEFFYDVTQARITLLVMLVAGFLTYGFGWALLVGFDGDRAWQADQRAAWFVMFGLAELFLLVIGIIAGFASLMV
jgi:hypothetical protein